MHLKLYQALFFYKKLAADNDAYLVGAGRKFNFFIQKSYFFFGIVNISVKRLWRPSFFFILLFFFQIIMVSPFACWPWSVHYENSIYFPFKTNYVNTEVYSVNSNYFIQEGKITPGKQENYCWSNSLINSTMYILIFCQNSWFFKGVLIHYGRIISPEN